MEFLLFHLESPPFFFKLGCFPVEVPPHWFLVHNSFSLLSLHSKPPFNSPPHHQFCIPTPPSPPPPIKIPSSYTPSFGPPDSCPTVSPIFQITNTTTFPPPFAFPPLQEHIDFQYSPQVLFLLDMCIKPVCYTVAQDTWWGLFFPILKIFPLCLACLPVLQLPQKFSGLEWAWDFVFFGDAGNMLPCSEWFFSPLLM